MIPSTIMGTHTRNLPCMCNRGYIPTRGYVLTTHRLEGCLLDVVSMRGWAMVRSQGGFRSTLGSLRPLSGLCPLGKYQNFFFSLLLGQLVKFFWEYFFNFFLTFSNFFQSYSYM